MVIFSNIHVFVVNYEEFVETLDHYYASQDHPYDCFPTGLNLVYVFFVTPTRCICS